MKNKKTNNPDKAKNVFAKILEDKKRINEAICKGLPLSSLKDIKFVKPV